MPETQTQSKHETTVAKQDSHFLDGPEVRSYMSDVLPALVSESDRGAVLLGASQIDEVLKGFFDALLPEATSGKRKKEILGLNGPFGSFSAKLDIAYACRLLPENVVTAIHKFRKLRNDVAHKPLPFQLDNHAGEVRAIFSLLGPGVGVGVANMTVEVMLRNFIERALEIKDPANEDIPLFKDPAAVAHYLSENRHHLEQLDRVRLRWELGVGLGLICGLIAYHQSKLVSLVGKAGTFAWPTSTDEGRNEAKDGFDDAV